ncbi:MAG: hypothetical protein ACR2FE_03890 [Aeromicrobium sp.]
MRVVSGLSSEQVASMTGRRPGAVRTRSRTPSLDCAWSSRS